MLNFEELAKARRDIRNFCLLHGSSLLALKSGNSFKLHAYDETLDDGRVHHLTTTATCISSLFDAFRLPRFADHKVIKEVRSAFAQNALLRKDWKSEGSAGIYCRCRALPTVILGLDRSGKDIKNQIGVIKEHIRVILVQVKKKPARFGLGEAGSALRLDDWYPPNAFHTYWALEIFELMETRFKQEFEDFAKPAALDLTRKREGMLAWARQQLGFQIGLHSTSPQSSMLDSDQLAWALTIFLRFDRNLKVDLENRDFLRQAFKCLFSTQADGTWRHYKPLFHYKRSGNAYCYVFETFAALLQSALKSGTESQMIRELLQPYCQNLLDLWRYAESTKMELWRGVEPSKKPDRAIGNEIGWCSGHRTNVTSPESWATSSVFSYSQALRRLIGIWCREEALGTLNTPQSHLDPATAAKKMVERGETWGINQVPVSERLQELFVNPVRMHECTDKLEPDSQPIEKDQARSAILFGPPGTSKTTLVRSLADVIGWNYVEIHANHFVAEGLTQVQKTADKIFRQLSELDHVVVLFDEIDELVRERDMEKDAFGRFLTTSMLPKLAELWEARKILYFVATNHINYFDSAIIRSHRFDSLMLVSPPSCTAKIKELTKLLAETHDLPGLHVEIKETDVQKALDQVETNLEGLKSLKSEGKETKEIITARYREEKLDPSLTIAKFALLRHDELDEVAYHLALILKNEPKLPTNVGSDVITAALKKVADSEWRKNKSYLDYLRDTRSERRDYQMLNVWEVITQEESVPGVESANNRKWIKRAVDSSKELRIPEFDLTFGPPGVVKVIRAVNQ
jgi:hypothetical protein